MAMAVFLLSPVTIRTVTPAPWHSSTARLIPSLSGSLIPTIPIIMRSFSMSDQFSGVSLTYLYVNKIVLRDYAAKFSMVSCINCVKSLLILLTVPFLLINLVQCSSKKSGAPLTKT